MSLELVKRENIGKKIKKEFRYAFSVEQSGIYAIIVSARAKIWVAKVVLNRVESKGWSANTIHDVILQKGQFDAFKQEDKNFKFVKNPLHDISQKDSWRESFRIAEEILSGIIVNPTEATHFHSYTETKDIEWFERDIVPNGKFLKKIDDIYFYWSPN